MKRVVSFCWYGNRAQDVQGVLGNLALLPVIYPGWTMRVYATDDVNEAVLIRVEAEGGEVIRMGPKRGRIEPMFWRFLPADSDDVDAFVSRDLDSRINVREAAAVREWLDSGKKLHLMHDHPFHTATIMGGMWGLRGGTGIGMSDRIQAWKDYDSHRVDQVFLARVVWPRFMQDYIEHGNERPFPPHAPYKGFVGEQVAVHN